MFYVYVYRDPLTSIPFYVGKGSGNRKYYHLWNRKTLKNSSLRCMIQEMYERGQRPLIEVTHEGADEESAYEEERRLINLYGRVDLGTGTLLNKTPGGEGYGNTGTRWSQEQHRKIKHRNTTHPKGKRYDQYTLDGKKLNTYSVVELKQHFKNSDINRIRLCCHGKAFSAAGFRWAHSSGNVVTLTKSPFREITQKDINTGCVIKTYISVSKASKETGINAGDIASCARGEMCSAGGYCWVATNGSFAPKLDRKRHRVVQLDQNGVPIREYRSVSAAARDIGIDKTNILRVCTGRRKTAGGFIWYYA